MTEINFMPRPEYPRPQFVRKEWINLNGKWTYTFDPSKSGLETGKELMHSKGFNNSIIIPFPPESQLSGVGYRDFIPRIWYHRKSIVPETWKGEKILLHFGAIFYDSIIFINGKPIKYNYGGSTPISIDITPYVTPEVEFDIVVMAESDPRLLYVARGKQSPKFKSYGCLYTRCTGIWQTVWIEPVDKYGVKEITIIPNVFDSTLTVIPIFFTENPENRIRVKLFDKDHKPITDSESCACNSNPIKIKIKDLKPWSPSDPYLYNLTIEVIDNKKKIIDTVESYAGIRTITIKENKLLLNGDEIYLRMVLNQGYYPDGIWTAPSDDALKKDIELTLAAGFNGARLHQKVFEPRFHYWADKLGHLSWAEFPDWGLNFLYSDRPEAGLAFWNMVTEWKKVVIRDRNHPSIIAWTPFNETGPWKVTSWDRHRRSHIDIYEFTKSLDSTRPVNDASGYVHHITDLWTVHLYDQDPKVLNEKLTPKDGYVFRNEPKYENEYTHQPYLVDEFGGIKWQDPDPKNPWNKESWGYGNTPVTIEEFYKRLEDIVSVILNQKHICGYCYTQLTDIELEQNGIYSYYRKPKFDINRIRSIFTKKRKN